MTCPCICHRPHVYADGRCTECGWVEDAGVCECPDEPHDNPGPNPYAPEGA